MVSVGTPRFLFAYLPPCASIRLLRDFRYNYFEIKNVCATFACLNICARIGYETIGKYNLQ